MLSSENLLLLIPAAGALPTTLHHRAGEAVLCVAYREPCVFVGVGGWCWAELPLASCSPGVSPAPTRLPGSCPQTPAHGVSFPKDIEATLHVPRLKRTSLASGCPHPESLGYCRDTLWPALGVGAVQPGEPRPDQTQWFSPLLF